MKTDSFKNDTILVKKIAFLLYIIISAALLSTSFASRAFKSVEFKEERTMTTSYDLESWEQLLHQDETVSDMIHGRLLKVKTNDYGRYDPAPAFVKPPFKLIPN